MALVLPRSRSISILLEVQPSEYLDNKRTRIFHTVTYIYDGEISVSL
jgi:hypothetical protein